MLKGIRNITRKDLGTTYQKTMVCDDMTFYVNAEECDDNGNTCAFYNDGTLASSNIFANHEFFQRLYVGDYEWISEDALENLKLILEQDGEEISDCAYLNDDPIDREFTVYVSPIEDSFISISRENDVIITHQLTDDMDELLKMEKTIDIVKSELDPSENPVSRDLFFTSASNYALQDARVYDIKNQKIIKLED